MKILNITQSKSNTTSANTATVCLRGKAFDSSFVLKAQHEFVCTLRAVGVDKIYYINKVQPV